MTLRTRILVGYGVAVALMVFLVVWAIVHLGSLGRASDAILSDNYASIVAADNMLDALERQDSAVLLAFAGDSAGAISHFRAHEEVVARWLERAAANVTIEGEAGLVRTIGAAYAAYRSRVDGLIAAWETGANAGDIGTYTATVLPLYVRVRDPALSLRSLNEEAMYAASDTAAAAAARAVGSTVLVAAVALLLAGLTSVAFADRNVRPIRRIVEATRSIALGDYAVEVPVETRGELGGLATEFNRMARELRRYHELRVDEVVVEKNKLEAVLEGIEDGLLVFDTALRVTSINAAAHRMLDVDLADGTSRGCADLLPFPAVCDLIRQTVETGRPPVVPDEERMVVFASRTGTKHAQFFVTPVIGRDAQPSGALLLIRDLTRLMDVERLKSEFVTAASHELRTPLASLEMSVDLLLERVAAGLADRDRELLQAAHEEVHRMKALVDDLLDLSRIEAGRIELAVADVAVATLFDHVRTIFGSQLERRAVTLATRLEPDLPDVRVDANKVTWVLTNLVSNALRYVTQGGHIQLTAWRSGRFVRVSVADDGPGIPPEVRARIFQKFVKVPGQETAGTGLGLAICKEIVGAHGGTIWVGSPSGRGSTFTFTLPVAT